MERPTKNLQNGRVRVSTTVSMRDWEYAKAHGLKWSNCIQAHIRNHRSAQDPNDPDADMGVWQLRQRLERVTTHRQKIFDVLQQILPKEEFNAFLEKL